MKFKTTSVFKLIILCFLGGCMPLFDNDYQKIEGRYHVGWIDSESSRSIVKGFDEDNPRAARRIVSPYIFEVGNNENYIIAKQHPLVGDFGNEKLITGITNYFVIEMENKGESNRGEKIFGPLNVKQFDSLRKDLEIENIKFDFKYKENPYNSDFFDPIEESYYIGYNAWDCTRAIESNKLLVGPYVYEMGHNKNFIIAKQHPYIEENGTGRINTEIINYFIIRILDKPSHSEEKIWGPLKSEQFDSLVTTLKIQGLRFDIKYPEKPEYCP